MSDALFDVPGKVKPAKMSADRRRTLRQADAIRKGVHPLALVNEIYVQMHPLGDREASADDSRSIPLRCGSCAHRKIMAYHNRSYPKCWGWADWFVTHGSATDVRAWWPACVRYSPGDSILSPDAARNIPELTS